jgi:hypothetical protein
MEKIFQWTCFGHVFSKACQNAKDIINDSIKSIGEVFQQNLQQFIKQPQKIRNIIKSG